MSGKKELAMKKSVFIIATIMMTAVSCTKETIQKNEDFDKTEDKEVYQGFISMEFNAVTDETKTTIGELSASKRTISWEKDDEIAIFFNDKSTTSKALTAGATTTFKAKVDDAPNYYAVYPSTAGAHSAGEVTISIPSTQDVRAGFRSAHYAAAVAKEGNLAFKNVCGWLRFTITDPTIKRVLIRGNGEQDITGNVTVTFDAEGNIATTTVTSGNSRLIVDVDGVGEYYVAVLPGLNLENGVGFRFYKAHDLASENVIETGIFSPTALAVNQGAIKNLGSLDTRIVKDWYIAPTAQGTGDGLSAENAAAGVEFLRSKMAQDNTNTQTQNGIAKGYGCIGITIHAATGEYNFGGQEIVVAWPGHTANIGTTIEGVAGTVFKTTGSRFFNLGNNADLRITNITLQGGDAGTGLGGAVLVNHETAWLRLTGCSLDGNQAGTGGAVYVSGNLVTDNTTFSNNSAPASGSAAGAVGIASTAGTVSLTNTNFTSNTASRHAGAFQNFGSSSTVVTITGGTFSNNKTTETGSGGGGAITFRGTGSTMTIDGVTFTGNTAANQGGAIRVNTANDISIKNCTITGNTAIVGGGLWINAGEVKVENTTINSNVATDKGGAIFVADASTTKLNGVKIYGNESKTYAGGINVDKSANVFMNACSVFNNSNTTTSTSISWGPAIFVNSSATTAYICINNSTFADHTTFVKASDTNIDMQGGNLVFANSTMIAKTAAGMLRVHTAAASGTFINSVIVNKQGNSINYNGPSGMLTSKYVLSGNKQNAYNPTADIDLAGLTYEQFGSPVFDATDHVYKWDGTLDVSYPAAPTADVASGFIQTANADFYAWLNTLGALGVDQLGNSRATNRQGAYCGI